MLAIYHNKDLIEAGLDEAGRGCLAGPVFAAAVVFPKGYRNDRLNDSKQLSEHQRNELRKEIEQDALAFAVASVDNNGIDRMNILKASFHAMNLAINKLTTKPEMLLIDGNRFINETDIPYLCIVKGDAKYQQIAAALRTNTTLITLDLSSKNNNNNNNLTHPYISRANNEY